MSFIRRKPCSKGHPRGGLFFVTYALALGSFACGPAAQPREALPAGFVPGGHGVPDPLAVYRSLGYIVGDRSFPAVGRFVFLPGPGDSTYAIFTLSLPNSGLRFRREPPGFLARYHVNVAVGDTLTPTAQLGETEDVRVRTFRETSRRDESIVYQGLLTLRPGAYPTRVEVRDLATMAGLIEHVEIRVPEFGPNSITAPIVVYQVRPRTGREEMPALILSPRATTQFGGEAPQLYLEFVPGVDSTAVLEVSDEGQVILSETLHFGPGEDSLRATVTELPTELLPPNPLTLSARLEGSTASDSSDLVIALFADWVAIDYEETMRYLQYAGAPEELDSLRNAPTRERARRLQTFWDKRDPDPETPENEFFERYFRRIQDANGRFSNAVTAGWLTDRGAVYIALGPPDEVIRHLDVQTQGPGQTQVWVYNESLGFEVRLVFVDLTGDGGFSLTVDARRDFIEALQTLYS